MTLGPLLLFVALLVVVALFVARPLVEADADIEDLGDPVASQWVAERERVLDALTELDSDWHMGKVPEDIYQEQRDMLLATGAKALEQLDRLTSKPSRQKKKEAKADDLEAMIAAYKVKRKRGK